MIKKTIALIIWLIAVALLHLFGNNAGTFSILLISIAVPGLSLFVLLVAAWRPEAVTLELPRSCTKCEEIGGTFTFKHSRLLKASCNLICENRFTGQRESLQFDIHKNETQFTIQALHCGALQICIEDITFHDPLGLFTRKIKTSTTQNVMVPPTGHAMEIAVLDNAFDPESNEFSTTKPGYDVSETYAIREYTPGDPIRSIHWKLSEKQDKTMVREFGLPISNATLLFFENAPQEVPPEGWDTAGEMFFSAMLALLENGAAVTAAWQQNDARLSQFEIRTTEDAVFVVGECFLTATRYGVPARDLLPKDFVNVMTISPGNGAAQSR